MKFYERDHEERVQLTEARASQGRTVIERWEALDELEASFWNARAAMAGELLSASESVADLGCGTMQLEKYLVDGTAYHPVDVVARDHRTIVVDFNVAPPSIIDAEAVACLGLLEYLYAPADLMRTLRQQYPMCVVSYCVLRPNLPLSSRRCHAWVAI